MWKTVSGRLERSSRKALIRFLTPVFEESKLLVVSVLAVRRSLVLALVVEGSLVVVLVVEGLLEFEMLVEALELLRFDWFSTMWVLMGWVDLLELEWELWDCLTWFSVGPWFGGVCWWSGVGVFVGML